jgi:uncharacterized protein YecT (DUF1311 family)
MTMKRAGIVSALLLAGSLHAQDVPPVKDPEPPGCGIEKVLGACTEEAGNGREALACESAALKAAETELDSQLAAIRRKHADDSRQLEALDEAQSAWKKFVDADCRTVELNWEGGALQGAQVAACRYGHTIRRARAVWTLYITGELPDCPAAE